MKLLTKTTRSGNKEGKDWQMTTLYLQDEKTQGVYEIVLFNAGTFPHIEQGDDVEPIYELTYVLRGDRRNVMGKIVGFNKA